MENTYFRKGFGLKNEIAGRLTADYHSGVVEAVRASDYRLEVGRLTFRSGARIRLLLRSRSRGRVRVRDPDQVPGPAALPGGGDHPQPPREPETARYGDHPPGPRPGRRVRLLGRDADDVVIMPAFGVTIGDFERLRAIGCVLVDTTCGSVLNVWKRVESYARDGFTAIIHGKHYHEETKATASQVMKYPDGRYLVVFDMAEARMICDFIEGEAAVQLLEARFRQAVSPGFDFERDLLRVGLGQSDHHAVGRVARHCRRSAPEHHPPLRGGECRRAFPVVRHHLLRHPGAPGRGPRVTAGAARRHGRRRGIQLQ